MQTPLVASSCSATAAVRTHPTSLSCSNAGLFQIGQEVQPSPFMH